MNEFMHFTPIFDSCKSFFAAVTVEAILSITLPVVFIFAVALVVAAALAAAPQRYTAAIHQSFAWWRVGVQMEDNYRSGLWYQARTTDTMDAILESPISEDLLSSNPLKARRARKAFWGEKWKVACNTLSPEERIAIYKRVLNK